MTAGRFKYKGTKAMRDGPEFEIRSNMVEVLILTSYLCLRPPLVKGHLGSCEVRPPGEDAGPQGDGCLQPEASQNARGHVLWNGEGIVSLTIQ